MNTTTFRVLIVCLATLAFSRASALAQFAVPDEKTVTVEQYVQVDYAYFRSDYPDSVRLELYYMIHHRGLTFNLTGGSYVANYELDVTVSDKDGRELRAISRDRQIVLRADEEARTRVDFRTSQINVNLPPGEYRVRFNLKDRNSSRVILKELKVDLWNLYGKLPRLSGVEFAQAFQKGTNDSSIFSKNDVMVVPSVQRSYGSVESDRIAYYFEIYPGAEQFDNVVVETKVRHVRRGLIYRDTLHIVLGAEPERQLREIALDKLIPGDYELVINVLGRRNKDLAERIETFKVAWTQDGLIRNDWKTALQQLKLFAEDVDVRDMEKLETIEDRIKAFDHFWQERDPTDGTPENEAKAAFYYRIRVANDQFGVMRMEGWRTDRGRIFVQYGEPDYLVNEPFSPDRHPYQIWYYTGISPNRRFAFVDEKEDGDFRLQYPYDGLSSTGDY
jgi:GWxTD domain-containing protein